MKYFELIVMKQEDLVLLTPGPNEISKFCSIHREKMSGPKPLIIAIKFETATLINCLATKILLKHVKAQNVKVFLELMWRSGGKVSEKCPSAWDGS